MQPSTPSSLSSLSSMSAAAAAASAMGSSPPSSINLPYHAPLPGHNAQYPAPPTYWHPAQPQAQQRGPTPYSSLSFPPSSAYPTAHFTSPTAMQPPPPGSAPHPYYPSLHHLLQPYHHQGHAPLPVPSPSSQSPFLQPPPHSASGPPLAGHHAASPAAAAAASLFFQQPHQQHQQQQQQQLSQPHQQQLSHSQAAAASALYPHAAAALHPPEHAVAVTASAAPGVHVAFPPAAAATALQSSTAPSSLAPTQTAAAFALPFSRPQQSHPASAALTVAAIPAERGGLPAVLSFRPSAIYTANGLKRKRSSHLSPAVQAERAQPSGEDSDDGGDELDYVDGDDDDEELSHSSGRVKRESRGAVDGVTGGGEAAGSRLGIGPYELELLQREVDELHDEAMAERLRAEDAESRYQRLVTQIRSMQSKLSLAVPKAANSEGTQPAAAEGEQDAGASPASASALRVLTEVKWAVDELLSQVALDTEGVTASTSSITTASSVAHARLSRFMSKQVAQGESAHSHTPHIHNRVIHHPLRNPTSPRLRVMQSADTCDACCCAVLCGVVLWCVVVMCVQALLQAVSVGDDAVQGSVQDPHGGRAAPVHDEQARDAAHVTRGEGAAGGRATAHHGHPAPQQPLLRGQGRVHPHTYQKGQRGQGYTARTSAHSALSPLATIAWLTDLTVAVPLCPTPDVPACSPSLCTPLTRPYHGVTAICEE